jgi:hypothetical protein
MSHIGLQLTYGLAIVSDLIFGLFSVLGYVIQRRSHLKEQLREPSLQRTSIKRPMWHVGFWLYVLFGTFASVLNLASLPFFVMVPLGASRLVYNVVYSHFLLHEDIGFHALLGTIYVALAATTIGICGNVLEPQRDVTDVLLLYRRTTFIVYQVLLSFFGIVIFIVVKVPRFLSLRGRGILFAVLGSIAASQAGLYAKTGIQLLNMTFFGHDNQFTAPLSFIVIAMMVLLSLLGLYFFNKSLATCETIVTIPITYCLSICLAVLNTFVYYDTLEVITFWKWTLMCISIVYLIYGVYLLATARVHYTGHLHPAPNENDETEVPIDIGIPVDIPALVSQSV